MVFGVEPLAVAPRGIAGSGPVWNTRFAVTMGRTFADARTGMAAHDVPNASERAGGDRGTARAPSPVPTSPVRQDADERVISAIREHVGQDQFDRYFGEGTSATVRDSALEIAVPNQTVARLIERRFGRTLADAAGVFGSGAPGEVRILVDRSNASAPTENRVSRPVASPPKPAPTPVRPRRALSDLGDKTFHRFVVGPSNRVAFEACRRVAQGDRTLPSVFIHGGCGMGKTHLLRASVRAFTESHHGAKVRYVTAEEFTNEFVEALRTSRVDSFRKAYRRLDLLCIDDVHFFASKEATQSELLHTLDAIAGTGARLILVSDEHPKDLRKISKHLASRFSAGPVVKIDPLDDTTRRDVIRHLAHLRGLSLTDDAVGVMASLAAQAYNRHGEPASVRDIEGMIVQTLATRNVLGSAAEETGDAGLVRRALQGTRDAGASRPRRPVAPDLIITETCALLRVERAEFTGKGRHKRVVMARALVARLARELTTLSYPEIARAMGRPNHSTIITACKKLASDLESSPPLALVDEVALGLSPECRATTLPELMDAVRRRVVAKAR